MSVAASKKEAPTAASGASLLGLPSIVLVSILSHLPIVSAARLCVASHLSNRVLTSPSPTAHRLWSTFYTGRLTTEEWIPVLKKYGPFIRSLVVGQILPVPSQPTPPAAAAVSLNGTAGGDNKNESTKRQTAKSAGFYSDAFAMLARSCPQLKAFRLGSDVRGVSDADVCAFVAATEQARITLASAAIAVTAAAKANGHAVPALIRTTSTGGGTPGLQHFSFGGGDFSRRPFVRSSGSRCGGGGGGGGADGGESDEFDPPQEESLFRSITFTDAGLNSLLTAFSSTLTHLNLSGCVAVTDDGLRAIASACEQRLTHIDIGYCNLRGDGLHAVLTRCTALTAIGLGMTQVSDTGIELALPLWLGAYVGSRLTHVELSGWSIGLYRWRWMLARCHCNLQTLILAEVYFESDAPPVRVPIHHHQHQSKSSHTTALPAAAPAPSAVKPLPTTDSKERVDLPAPTTDGESEMESFEFESEPIDTNEFADCCEELDNPGRDESGDVEELWCLEYGLKSLAHYASPLRVLDLYAVAVNNAAVDSMRDRFPHLQRIRFGPGIWSVSNTSIHQFLSGVKAFNERSGGGELCIVRDGPAFRKQSSAETFVFPSNEFDNSGRSGGAVRSGADLHPLCSVLRYAGSIGVHGEDRTAHGTVYIPVTYRKAEKTTTTDPPPTADRVDTKRDLKESPHNNKACPPVQCNWTQCSITGMELPPVLFTGTNSPGLSSLNLATSVKPSGWSGTDLQRMVSGTHQLQSITLSFCSELSDADLVPVLKHCAPSLTALDLDEVHRLSDDVLRALATSEHYSQQLRVLHISGEGMTDAGVNQMWQVCRGLNELGLSRMPHLTDAAFGAIPATGKQPQQLAGSGGGDSKSVAPSALRLRFQKLVLWGCDQLTIASVVSVLRVAPYLLSLDIHGSIGINRNQLVVELSTRAPVLSHLDLSGIAIFDTNALTQSALELLARSSLARSLHTLDLSTLGGERADEWGDSNAPDFTAVQANDAIQRIRATQIEEILNRDAPLLWRYATITLTLQQTNRDFEAADSADR